MASSLPSDLRPSATLLNMPTEILNGVLSNLSLLDKTKAALTCRSFYSKVLSSLSTSDASNDSRLYSPRHHLPDADAFSRWRQMMRSGPSLPTVNNIQPRQGPRSPFPRRPAVSGPVVEESLEEARQFVEIITPGPDARSSYKSCCDTKMWRGRGYSGCHLVPRTSGRKCSCKCRLCVPRDPFPTVRRSIMDIWDTVTGRQ